MWKVARENHVIEQELSYHSFPQSFGEFRIFFISDIHRRIVSKKIIAQVKGKVDIVIIGGDLTEKGVPYTRTEENLRRLTELGPTYFIWGNNDYEKNTEKLLDIFKRNSVTVLENEYAIIQTGTGEKIYLVGIGEVKCQEVNLDKILKPIPKDAFRIAVCHNPEIYSEIKKENQISLLLSGHTHGGQIHLFGFGLYPKGKFYKNERGDCLISNGYGTTKLPLRLGAKPETHMIKLSGKNDSCLH